jgi:hypothetical protein
MSKLRKACDEVKALSEGMVAARSIDARANDLRKAGDELSEQVNNLSPLVESLTVLRSVPELKQQVALLAAPATLTEEISKTRRDAAKAGVRMIEDAAINLSSLRSKLANWRSTLADMSGVWQAYVKARFEPMDKALLDALDRCGYQPLVKALRESGTAINSASQRPPRSHREFELFSSAVEKYQNQLSDLDAPAAVQTFLAEAVAGGASLAALTPEVRSWLAARGLEPNFQVKVRPAGFLRQGGMR